MRMKFKKCIPLWVKAPLSILLREVGKWPLNVVIAHMHRVWSESCHCSENSKLRAYLHAQKATYTYLSKRYGKVADQLLQNPTPGEKPKAPTIWVFWWQGEVNAPEIIKGCINSLRRHAGAFRLQVVDSTNYQSFATVSDVIEKKRQDRIISLTHFSDYLRMLLLETHGGIWIDATIFTTKDFDAVLLDQPLFTVRNSGKDPLNVSNWEWTGSALGGWKGNSFFAVWRKLLETYWEEHHMMVDYFLIDYFIRLIYNCCPMVREELKAISDNNSGYYELQNAMNLPLDESQWARLNVGDTWLYKLSWKGQYDLQTADGRETFYARWRQENVPQE